MSTRRPTRTRTLARVVTVAAAAVLVGSAAPAALADPAAVDTRDLSCAALLQQATSWPGTDAEGHPIFSDRYESYLLSQPACASPRA
ncbi:hypothetical protein GCU56_09095 [Geodermatophilus sabuli]|uniref:Secreted protein n=1 Tax=Geodermatophilus sabuli TaxID=1564158 RepID=A0A7K3W282_9ACTN|nr:hypothetical protein [Geodermatophilus sabuli]NEK58027.1 hypothetical protein [Geodermatophilus sabuli]